MSDELRWFDAVDLAAGVASGRFSERESVDAAVDRVAALDPELNYVVTAVKVDPPPAHGRRPLAGIPILVKDAVAECRGLRHTEGSRFLSDHVPAVDDTFVRRLREAGATIIGTTNTAEFGNASTAEPERYGPSRNPWDRSRTTGGSSGGSAGAVAVGMVPAAHGTDGGGSIRIPASCCGTLGLKPSRGLNPLGPWRTEIFGGLYVQGMLTRSVRDSALFLDVTSGPELGVSAVTPRPQGGFLAALNQSPPAVRIRYTSSAPTGSPVEDACVVAVEKVADLLSQLGHEVSFGEPRGSWANMEEAFFDLWSDGNAWMIQAWAERLGEEASSEKVEPLTWALVERGRARSSVDHQRTLHVLSEHSQRVGYFFSEVDVWLTPTLGQAPVPLGALVPPPENPLAMLESDAVFAPFTWIANVTGQPAISVPVHMTADGLPIGVQLMARFGEDALLLQLAAQLEAALPWSARRPPV